MVLVLDLASCTPARCSSAPELHSRPLFFFLRQDLTRLPRLAFNSANQASPSLLSSWDYIVRLGFGMLSSHLPFTSGTRRHESTDEPEHTLGREAVVAFTDANKNFWKEAVCRDRLTD